MSNLPKPPRFINPLWIIFLFFSFSEIVLGFAVFNTSGGIQVALTVFAIVFPLLVAIGFFLLLIYRPSSIYGPQDYRSDAAFLKGIEGDRKARAGLLKLDKDIQDRIDKFLTSEKFIKKLSSLQSSELKKTLQATAQDISSEIREDKFFTVSLSPLSPDLGDLTLPVDGFANFNDLTDEVYYALNGSVEPYTYGSFWMLRDQETGDIFKHARMIYDIGPGKPVEDRRTLDEVGIRAGMVLEAIRWKG